MSRVQPAFMNGPQESLPSAAFRQLGNDSRAPVHLGGNSLWTAMEYRGIRNRKRSMRPRTKPGQAVRWRREEPDEANMGADGKNPLRMLIQQPQSGQPNPAAANDEMKVMFPGFPWTLRTQDGHGHPTGVRKPRASLPRHLWMVENDVRKRTVPRTGRQGRDRSIGWSVITDLPTVGPGPVLCEWKTDMQVWIDEVYSGTEKGAAVS